jgi:thiol-disulfide isomerase/thioredoxin
MRSSTTYSVSPWLKSLVSLALACLSMAAVTAAAGELSPAKATAPVDLRLPDSDGHERRLDEFRGKVVLVNFWASWCTACIEEMPSLQRLAELMRGKRFAVLGVNVAEADLRVKAMVERLGIGFPVLLDRESEIFRRWGVTVLPTTYVLDGEGVVRYVGRGPMEWDALDIVEALERLGAAEAAQ